MRKRQGNGKGMSEARMTTKDSPRGKAKEYMKQYNMSKDKKWLDKVKKVLKMFPKKDLDAFIKNNINESYMSESVTTAEDGIMDTLEHGPMTKDEVFKMIKKEYRLKRHEFNQAWDALKDDGDIFSAGGNKYKRS